MRRMGEKGFTLVEIMIVVAIIALLAAIAIPNVLRGRATANESAAISNIRSLASSLEMYRASNSAYPATWTLMTGATPAYAPSAFGTSDLAAGSVLQGYTYTYAYTDANNYSLTANRVSTNDGSRAFYVDEDAVVRHCTGGSGALPASNPVSVAPNATCP